MDSQPGLTTWAITGSTGLVGRALLDALLDKDIRALYRKSRGSQAVHWIQGDLDSEQALAELCDGRDVVVHVAGLTAGNKEALHNVNVAGTARLAKVAREAGVQHFVLISSQAAREEHLSNYAQSKAEGERAALHAAGEMKVSIIRPPAVLGADDPAMQPILQALKFGLLPVPGVRHWRERRLSLVTADQLARDIIDVAKSGADQPFEPATVASFSWNDLAKAAGEQLGKNIATIPVPSAALYGIGALADGLRALGWVGGVFGRGKAAEMLHHDWSVHTDTASQIKLAQALAPFLPPPSVPLSSDAAVH
ncbi:MAG: NAD-dependent epimerase/dehydratase family protein [Pseudomonadota bacterium]